MVEEIQLSDSPIFDIDDETNEFTLNLSEQLAIVNNERFLEIENVDSSGDETDRNDRTPFFPVLSQANTLLIEDQTCDVIPAIQSTTNQEILRDIVKVRRRGRPPKPKQLPLAAEAKKSHGIGAPRVHSNKKKSFTQFRVKKSEGYTVKLNGKIYQIASRDLNVVEVIENKLNEIRNKINQSSCFMNKRTLTLDMNQIETVLGVLEDDRLELKMTEEAWNEIFMVIKNTFREIQKDAHGQLSDCSALESIQSGIASLNKPAVKLLEASGRANHSNNSLPTRNTADLSIETGVNKDYIKCTTKHNSKRHSQPASSKKTQQISVEKDDGKPKTLSPRLHLLPVNSPNVPAVQGANSQSFGSIQTSQINHPVEPDIKFIDHSTNFDNSSKETESLVLERLKRLTILTYARFDLRSIVKKGHLSPGKNVTMLFQNLSSTAYIQDDGTLKSNKGRYLSISDWVNEVAGKRFSRFSKREQRSFRLFYENVPLEEVLKEEIFAWERKHYNTNTTSDANISSSNATSMRRIQLNSSVNVSVSNESLNATVNNLNQRQFVELQLVPDKVTEKIKSFLIHSENEYFSACKCYEQCWAGKEPFPYYLLQEVDNW